MFGYDGQQLARESLCKGIWTMTTATLPIVSADSHVTEPVDLWETRIDRRFRDHAPRYVFDEAGQQLNFIVEGQVPRQVSANIMAGQRPEDYAAFFKKGIEAARPGGWDTTARLADMDLDGIHAAVNYTSQGFSLFQITDAAYQEACFRTYNDWLAEYCAAAPKRLFGIALVSLFDIDRAVAELRHCHKLGLRGAMIWGAPPEDLPFGSDHYAPFWAEAEALGIPLSLHIGTGGDRAALAKAKDPEPYWRNMGALISLPSEIQRALVALLFSGVLENHPGLRFVSAEYDIGWIPYFLQNVDALYRRWAPVAGYKLAMAPSDYFRRQVRATFIREPVGLKTVAAGLIDPDCVMWCDDYPHGASTWPKSQEVIGDTMAALTVEQRQKITHDNVVALYNIDLAD